MEKIITWQNIRTCKSKKQFDAYHTSNAKKERKKERKKKKNLWRRYTFLDCDDFLIALYADPLSGKTYDVGTTKPEQRCSGW